MNLQVPRDDIFTPQILFSTIHEHCVCSVSCATTKSLPLSIFLHCMSPQSILQWTACYFPRSSVDGLYVWCIPLQYSGPESESRSMQIVSTNGNVHTDSSVSAGRSFNDHAVTKNDARVALLASSNRDHPRTTDNLTQARKSHT